MFLLVKHVMPFRRNPTVGQQMGIFNIKPTTEVFEACCDQSQPRNVQPKSKIEKTQTQYMCCLRDSKAGPLPLHFPFLSWEPSLPARFQLPPVYVAWLQHPVLCKQPGEVQKHNMNKAEPDPMIWLDIEAHLWKMDCLWFDPTSNPENR